MTPLKTLRSLVAVYLLVALPQFAVAASGGQGSGGGSDCEAKIKDVRDDISTWLRTSNVNELKDLGPNEKNFVRSMQEQITKAKISCVSVGDIGYPVQFYNEPKDCKFEKTSTSSKITCQTDKIFANTMTAEGRYRLVFHEYASLAEFEIPQGSDSDYHLSKQISAEGHMVYKIVVKKIQENLGQSISIIIAGDSSTTNRVIVMDKVSDEQGATLTRFQNCDTSLKDCRKLESAEYNFKHPQRSSKNVFTKNEVSRAHRAALETFGGSVLGNILAIPVAGYLGWAAGGLAAGAAVSLPVDLYTAMQVTGTVGGVAASGAATAAGPKGIIKDLNVIRSFDFSKIFTNKTNERNIILAFPDDSLEEVSTTIIECLNP